MGPCHGGFPSAAPGYIIHFPQARPKQPTVPVLTSGVLTTGQGCQLGSPKPDGCQEHSSSQFIQTQSTKAHGTSRQGTLESTAGDWRACSRQHSWKARKSMRVSPYRTLAHTRTQFCPLCPNSKRNCQEVNSKYHIPGVRGSPWPHQSEPKEHSLRCFGSVDSSTGPPRPGMEQG